MDEKEKAELYRRLVSQADETLVLERMRAYGLWPEDEPVPELPEEQERERQRLTDEVERLQNRVEKSIDADTALAEERVRRWRESKKRRALARAEREEERRKRSEAYGAYRAGTVVHAGPEISGGLEDTTTNADALESLGLPVLRTPEALAAALGIELKTLRWLTYHRRAATLVHYHRYDIPKKTGGRRGISAPKPKLAAAQEWVLRNVLEGLPVEDCAHGFVRGRSIVTNATPHVNRAVVINLDLQDFFPSVTFRRVRGFFASLGYSGQIATLLALLCTEPPRSAATLDGRIYYVALAERRLPQGACTSPAITNGIARKLDRRLKGIAGKYGYAYTRYADDLTFSSDSAHNVSAVLWSTRKVVGGEGFRVNEKKTRIMRRGRRQEVTGLTVNDGLAISRPLRRQLRAILHNASQRGLAAENREDHSNFAAHLRGRVAHVQMVLAARGDTVKSDAWVAALHRALRG